MGAPSGRRMPAEWEPHTRTWMAFPPPNETFGQEGSDTLRHARTVWASVARVVARHEQVIVLAGVGQEATARAELGPGIDVVEIALDDAWLRDSGPTFVIEPDGSLGAVDWAFNGWGAQEWASWDADARVGSAVAELAGATRHGSSLVNEGGGIHVDGDGTVLLTETVQLDPARNSATTKEDVEAEVHAQLGTTTAIWLPRGLARDYDRFGTRGHVDIVATFVRPGVIAAHSQPDPAHPDHEVTRDVVAQLRATSDAQGRRLEVVEVLAPTVLEADGGPADYSYINHLVANGAVVVGMFDDPRDEIAAEQLARLYPGRVIERVDGRSIFAHGGGVHCITQQQPRTG